MRVLVACEESQAVTKSFRELGHEAYSCDILPCSGGHAEWHLQQDVTPLLDDEWDLIIAFPDCSHLAVSRARWFPEKIKDGRQQAAIDFFMLFANCKCPKVAIENPIGIMSTVWRKPCQIVQPYFFGDSYTKTTALWLRNLPKLIPTNIVDKGKRIKYPSGKSLPAWYANLPPKTRKGLRAKFPEGMSKAMAMQWGGKIN